MASVVTRKIPEIVLVDKSELRTRELFTLNVIYKIEIDEFVICPHQMETIYLNKAFKGVNDLISIINKFMEQKYINSETDKLYERFKTIAGENAAVILNSIWLDWRKARTETDTKEEAEEVLKKVKQKRIKKYMRPRKNIIKKVFDIGFGLYDKKAPADFRRGAENAFVYGYLCALEDMESNGMR